MNDSELWFTLAIYIAGLALLVAEVFIPSGGLILLCAISCITYSLYELFTNDHEVIGSVLIPFTLLFGVVLLRWAIRKISSTADLGEATATGARVEEARALVGTRGTVVTPLHPAGSAEFDGKRYPVVSQGGFVEAGEAVEIAQVSGNRIVVRSVEAPHL